MNKVVITTIQRLYSILPSTRRSKWGPPSPTAAQPLVRDPPPLVYNRFLPPEFFDLVVVDECHRSIYTLWRQVLEYFDASLIGLTATPAAHTYALFHRNVVSEYTHVQAVRDRVSVPYEVYEILTRVGTRGGGVVAVAEKGNARRGPHLRSKGPRPQRHRPRPDPYGSPRDTRKALHRHLPRPQRSPQTLVFAKSDEHAEDVLRILREEWALSNEAAIKTTYRPERQEGDAKRPSASHSPRS